MWQAWTNGNMGFLLMIAAFSRMDRIECIKYNLAVGILIAIVGRRMMAERPWQGWLSVVMGLWFVVAAFIPPLNEGDGFLLNNVVAGTLVAIIGFTALGGDAEMTKSDTKVKQQKES